jgi:hypothetical protein
MGLLSIAFGAWMAFYFGQHPFRDPFVTASGWAAAVLMIAFGAYVLVRRWRHGPQA